MDHTVALVQAYLRVNGYFTVTEYPVIVPGAAGQYRTATDLDVLALRFPHAGHSAPSPDATTPAPDSLALDPALRTSADQPDMLIAEVKEGRAELNAGAPDAAVLEAVLGRFGCCDAVSASEIAAQLRRHGRATLPNGHPVRLAAFGSTAGDTADGRYLRLTHGHILWFLRDHLRRHWDSVRVGEAKAPALGPPVRPRSMQSAKERRQER